MDKNVFLRHESRYKVFQQVTGGVFSAEALAEAESGWGAQLQSDREQTRSREDQELLIRLALQGYRSPEVWLGICIPAKWRGERKGGPPDRATVLRSVSAMRLIAETVGVEVRTLHYGPDEAERLYRSSLTIQAPAAEAADLGALSGADLLAALEASDRWPKAQETLRLWVVRARKDPNYFSAGASPKPTPPADKGGGIEAPPKPQAAATTPAPASRFAIGGGAEVATPQRTVATGKAVIPPSRFAIGGGQAQPTTSNEQGGEESYFDLPPSFEEEAPAVPAAPAAQPASSEMEEVLDEIAAALVLRPAFREDLEELQRQFLEKKLPPSSVRRGVAALLRLPR